MSHCNCGKKPLRFPGFVENACCNPCCDKAVQAAVVSAASDTANPCCCGCCCCGCCGCGGNVGGANTNCGCGGNVGGANTNCGCGGNVGGVNTDCDRPNVCDVSGIWDLPPRFPGCGFRPYCPCDPDRFPLPPI